MTRQALQGQIAERQAMQRFYEAAEGPQYFAERSAREANQTRLDDLLRRLEAMAKQPMQLALPL